MIGRQLGNPALYKYFLKVLHREALVFAETAIDNELEAFRLLHVRCDPPGAANDFESFHRLTRVNPAKNLQELPRLIAAWELELKQDKIMIAVMLRLAPASYAKDMRKDQN